MDPYSTNYGLNFEDQPTENQSTEAVRPKTSRGLRPSYELEGAIGWFLITLVERIKN